MITRCRNTKNPGYQSYGAKGVTVCDRWLEFELFLADMGERPLGTTIDRIESSGNYEPGNCRWATHVEQNNNRRNNIVLTVGGVTKVLSAWAQEMLVDARLIWSRIFHRGWGVEEAVLTPTLKRWSTRKGSKNREPIGDPNV